MFSSAHGRITHELFSWCKSRNLQNSGLRLDIQQLHGRKISHIRKQFSGEAKEALVFDIIKRKEETCYYVCWLEQTALAGGQTG